MKKSIRNKFLTISDSSYSKRDSLYSLQDDDGKVNFGLLKEKVNTWCEDGVDLNHILKQLTIEQAKELLPSIFITKVLGDEGGCYWAFRGLSVEMAAVLAEFLAKNVRILPRQLGEMLKEQPTEIAKVILENFKTELPLIIKSVNDISIVASYIGECTTFYEEVLPVLDLSTILTSYQHIRTLPSGKIYKETIAIQIAKQANTIFQKNHFSMHDFMNIIVFVPSENTEYYNLMYLAMLQALPKVLNYATNKQNNADPVTDEIFYFLKYLKNSSQEVQNKVWSALKEHLPRIITQSKEKMALLRDYEKYPEQYWQFLSIFPDSYKRDDLVHFSPERTPLAALIIELSAYKKERNKNPNNYYYFGIFKCFGAYSKAEKFDAVDNLIKAVFTPENAELDSKHIAVLSQGNVSRLLKRWARDYGLDCEKFLNGFQKNDILMQCK
ncbi:hypothetical protein ACFORL_00225 [Legionella dresdenensis]|uniref:Uncharacterized protein n=1 Tax=Legionella dresdenensis TaxID=450200 RepID=A0ABV8CC23_9GAMM